MRESNIQAQTGLMDFLSGVVAAIIKIQPLGFTALIQSATKGVNHIHRIIPVKEFTVSNQTRGIINKGDEVGLTP